MVCRPGNQISSVEWMRRDPRGHNGSEREPEAAARPCDRVEGTRGLGLGPLEFVSRATVASGGAHEVFGMGVAARAGASRSMMIICP
jgi:hypothetical protein